MSRISKIDACLPTNALVTVAVFKKWPCMKEKNYKTVKTKQNKKIGPQCVLVVLCLVLLIAQPWAERGSYLTQSLLFFWFCW